MPILELFNDTCNAKEPKEIARIVAGTIKSRGDKLPGFYFFRTTWVNPTTIVDAVAELRRAHPEVDFEVLDPHTFFALFKESQERHAKTGAK